MGVKMMFLAFGVACLATLATWLDIMDKADLPAIYSGCIGMFATAFRHEGS